jgi:DNA-binding NarL/FixJ family response regulator
VHTIVAGDSLLSPSVTRRMIERLTHQPAPELATPGKVAQWTPPEREVLQLIDYVKRILMRVEVGDRVQAVIFVYETGLPASADASSRVRVGDPGRPPA